jgi:hypothetical protein
MVTAPMCSAWEDDGGVFPVLLGVRSPPYTAMALGLEVPGRGSAGWLGPVHIRAFPLPLELASVKPVRMIVCGCAMPLCVEMVGRVVSFRSMISPWVSVLG